MVSYLGLVDRSLRPRRPCCGRRCDRRRSPSLPGVTLALNFNDEAAVDEALAHAVDAGARLGKPGTRADWGGYSGYFADPDGHLWEAAFVPDFHVSDDGTIDIHN